MGYQGHINAEDRPALSRDDTGSYPGGNGGRVTRAINDQEKILTEIHDEISMLLDTLDPVVLEGEVSAPMPTDKPVDPENPSRLAHKIMENNSGLIAALRRLQAIRSRIDL